MQKLEDNIKKNILDLQYNKYLQYYNTSIIILFTYTVGVVIGFVTEQINYNDVSQMVVLGFLSLVVVSIIALLLMQFKDHQGNILLEIKKLNIQ